MIFPPSAQSSPRNVSAPAPRATAQLLELEILVVIATNSRSEWRENRLSNASLAAGSVSDLKHQAIKSLPPDRVAEHCANYNHSVSNMAAMHFDERLRSFS